MTAATPTATAKGGGPGGSPSPPPESSVDFLVLRGTDLLAERGARACARRRRARYRTPWSPRCICRNAEVMARPSASKSGSEPGFARAASQRACSATYPGSGGGGDHPGGIRGTHPAGMPHVTSPSRISRATVSLRLTGALRGLGAAARADGSPAKGTTGAPLLCARITRVVQSGSDVDRHAVQYACSPAARNRSHRRRSRSRARSTIGVSRRLSSSRAPSNRATSKAPEVTAATIARSSSASDTAPASASPGRDSSRRGVGRGDSRASF